MSQRRTLEVVFASDVRDLKAGLSQVDASTKATGQTVSNFATGFKLALSGVAVAGVVALVDRMGDLAVAAEATEKRASVVFGSLAAEAQQWAAANNEAFGLSTSATLGLAASVQDLLVPLGFTRSEAFELTKTTLGVANALSEWTGGTRTAAEAQQIITKAILGERDGLVELGVKISEADLQQRLLSDGTAELTGEALKMAEAEATLALIMDRSADAFTAATDGTTSLLRERKALEAIRAEAEERLATQTLPLLTQGYIRAAQGAGLMAGAMDVLSHLGDTTERQMALVRSQVGFLAATVGDFTGSEAAALIKVLEGVRAGAGFTEEAFETLISEVGASPADIEEAARGLETMGESFGFNRRQIENLVPRLLAAAEAQRILMATVTEAEQSFLGVSAAIETAAQQTAALEEATADLEARQREALDPVAKLAGAHVRLAEANAEVNRLHFEGRTHTDEYRDAVIDLLTAQGDLNVAKGEFAATVGPDELEMLDRLAAQLGLNIDQLLTFLDITQEINATPLGVSVGPVSGPGGGPSILQHGGPFPRDRTAWVGERGPELVRFTSPGVVTAAQDSPRRQRAAPLIGTIILQGTPADLARRVAEQVAREARFSL